MGLLLEKRILQSRYTISQIHKRANHIDRFVPALYTPLLHTYYYIVILP